MNLRNLVGACALASLSFACASRSGDTSKSENPSAGTGGTGAASAVPDGSGGVSSSSGGTDSGSGGAAPSSGGTDGTGGGTTVDDPTCGFTDADGTGPDLAVDNLTPGETIPHQLVRLVGRLDTPANEVTVVHGSSTQIAPTSSDGLEFTVFAILEPGDNTVGIKAEGHSPLCFPVSFSEPVNDYTFRYVVHAAVDHQDDKFVDDPGNALPPLEPTTLSDYSCLTGEPCDLASMAERMRMMALVNQMYMAESMVHSGAPRKTFSLMREPDGSIRDPLFVSEMTVDEMVEIIRNTNNGAGDPIGQGSWAMMDNVALPEIVDQEEDEGIDPSMVKHMLTFMDVGTGSWGGGRGASIGNVTIYSWPRNLQDLYDKLQDNRDPVDAGANPAQTMSDTVRITWTNGSGTLMHEAGHALGVGDHSVSPQDCATMGGGGGGNAMHMYLFAGPDNDVPWKFPGNRPCWTTDNNLDDHANHLDIVSNSPWIKAWDE